MSSESYKRKVKSLNDIVEVFGTRNNTIRSIQSENSKFYTTNTAESYKELNRSIKNARIKRKDENENENENEKTVSDPMELAEQTKSLNVDLGVQLTNDSKTSPLDIPNLTDALFEEEKPNHKRNSTHVSRKRVKMQKRILSIGDSFLSMILITPLAVGFWEGTWTMMDLHGEWFPGVFCFLFGVLLHTSFAIFKNFLQDRVADAWRKKTCSSVAVCKLAQILYTYIFGVACILHWRGGWIVFDWFFAGRIW
ncbi:uncharacterized protein LOC128891378 [Hylaeus anthracinus]|uniref:uncharacterized protein LOC128891378 n=1 Tax=Hylaeus anthracinus TaxID=313031 RepID=UPI0023B95398|nr:uncharacterized protein LOC128891378 [Hylaeus anthracinus]